MNEEIMKVFEGIKSELLTEDVQKKIATLIEAKVSEKVNAKVEELNTKAEEFKTAETARLEEAAVQWCDGILLDTMANYMDYACEEYFKENKKPIENNLKAEMFDSIVSGMKKVLSENQIKEDKIVEKEELAKKNTELSEKLNDTIKKSMEYQKEIQSLKAVQVFESVSSGLSVSDKEKMRTLSGDFDISDLGELKSKLETLKGSLANFGGEQKKVEDEKIHESVNSDEGLEGADGVKFLSESPVLTNIENMNQYL